MSKSGWFHNKLGFFPLIDTATQKIILFSLHRHSNTLFCHTAWPMHTNHQTYFLEFWNAHNDELAQSQNCTHTNTQVKCLSFRVINYSRYANASSLLHQQSQQICWWRLIFLAMRACGIVQSHTRTFYACDGCHAHHDSFEIVQSKFSIYFTSVNARFRAKFLKFCFIFVVDIRALCDLCVSIFSEFFSSDSFVHSSLRRKRNTKLKCNLVKIQECGKENCAYKHTNSKINSRFW